MATRILGPAGSKKRRRFLFVPILLVACAALFMVAGAQAVYNTGLFQLDGNAQVGVTGSTVWGPGGAEDWDNVCKKYAVAFDANNNTPGSDICHPSSATVLNGVTATTADRSTFVTDAFKGTTDDIYKGGTDDGSINSAIDGVGGSPWSWKQATPSPAKADIEQAFAALYKCTSACGTTYSGHKIMYFGGTRLANNGDTNLGIWLLHNKVTTAGTGSVTDPTTGAISCPASSGCGFSGSHTPGNVSLGGTKPGDIFIQSAFTSNPQINIYEWVGPNNATTCVTNACDLQQIPLGAGQANKCPDSATGTAKACALVNDLTTVCAHATGTCTSGAVPSPWLFKDSSPQSPLNVLQDSELFEGGIDLTALGFGNSCTSTFELNTRSSGSSINSTAQDFALGQLGSCQTTLTTTAGDTTATGGVASPTSIGSGSVSSGTDTANLTVQGVDTFNGDLKFYLCGPLASIPLATGTGCKDTGVLVTTVNNVSSNGNYVSGQATLTSAGIYCWFSKFTPDADTAANGVTAGSDDGTTDPAGTTNKECFTVAKVTPGLATTAIYPNPSPPPAFIAIGNSGFQTPFGSAVYDKGTLSGAATEPGSLGPNSTYPTINPTVAGGFAGTIGFTLKGPDSTTATNCTDNATAYTGELQTFPVPNGVSPAPAHGVAVTGNVTYGGDGSIHWTPGSPGKYHWLATYTNTGSANNTSPVNHNGACDDTGEDVIVQQISTTTSTVQSWVPNDKGTAQATAAGGNTLQGTLQFQLFPNATCNGTTTLYDHTFGTTANPLVANAQGKIIVDTATSLAPNTVAIHKLDGAAGGYPAVSWLVTFTPVNDASHTGSSNSCDEQTNLSITDSP